MEDRHNKGGDVKALKRMSQDINKGNPLVIFPKRITSKQAPVLAPFLSGVFAISIQTQIPIVLVTFAPIGKDYQVEPGNGKKDLE